MDWWGWFCDLYTGTYTDNSPIISPKLSNNNLHLGNHATTLSGDLSGWYMVNDKLHTGILCHLFGMDGLCFFSHTTALICSTVGSDGTKS